MLFQYGIPHLKKDILALESVQHLATKICTKAWHGVPYEDRLNQLSLITLESRRRFLNLCYLFKTLNRLTYFPNSPLHLITTSYETRSHSQTLIYIPTVKTNLFQNSFFCQIPNFWNSLPQAVVSSESLRSCKHLLRENFN